MLNKPACIADRGDLSTPCASLWEDRCDHNALCSCVEGGYSSSHVMFFHAVQATGGAEKAQPLPLRSLMARLQCTHPRGTCSYWGSTLRRAEITLSKSDHVQSCGTDCCRLALLHHQASCSPCIISNTQANRILGGRKNGESSLSQAEAPLALRLCPSICKASHSLPSAEPKLPCGPHLQ